MKKWFIPSWNGDVRLEASSLDANKTVLVAFEPTPAEQEALIVIGKTLLEKKWIEKLFSSEDLAGPIAIDAPLEKVGPVVVALLKPGPAVLTAVRLKNGQVEVVEHREPGKATVEALEAVAEKPATAAATVKRPTPSCPDCYVNGANVKASEVLLSFLTKEQHATWKTDRYIVVRGGLTKHLYIIAHRNSEIAAKNGRICFDSFDKDVLHFHDQSVPPEEEVLAAMLCLQFREPWLRNEATCFYGLRFTKVFKNPFGDVNDGVLDANITKTVGILAAAFGDAS